MGNVEKSNGSDSLADMIRESNAVALACVETATGARLVGGSSPLYQNGSAAEADTTVRIGNSGSSIFFMPLFYHRTSRLATPPFG